MNRHLGKAAELALLRYRSHQSTLATIKKELEAAPIRSQDRIQGGRAMPEQERYVARLESNKEAQSIILWLDTVNDAIAKLRPDFADLAWAIIEDEEEIYCADKGYGGASYRRLRAGMLSALAKNLFGVLAER